jgi:hypothetical protein
MYLVLLLAPNTYIGIGNGITDAPQNVCVSKEKKCFKKYLQLNSSYIFMYAWNRIGSVVYSQETERQKGGIVSAVCVEVQQNDNKEKRNSETWYLNCHLRYFYSTSKLQF